MRARYAPKRFGEFCVRQPILGGGATLVYFVTLTFFMLFVRA